MNIKELKQRIKELKKEIHRLEDENNSLWFLLDEFEKSNIANPEYHQQFKEVFQQLCGNQYLWDTECNNSIEEVQTIADENGLYVMQDDHYYEHIQKYDMWLAGWDDNDSVFVVVKEHGDINATSPNQIAYRTLWGRYNTIKTLSVNAGKFMLINRVVSMVDALLLAKKWNNKNNIKLSLHAYPDLRNKSGLGGMKLSLQWK